MTNIRRVEIVHRKLGATADGAPTAANSSGPWQVTHPGAISHWAMRVEKVANGGLEEDNDTWTYFGLVAPNKFGWQVLMSTFWGDVRKVTLSDERFTSLDSPGQRIAGRTTCGDETIKIWAQNLIDTWGEYHLFRNNCQDFAVMLLCQTAHEIIDKDKAREVLADGHGALQFLAKTRSEDTGVFDRLGHAATSGYRVVVWDRKNNRLDILGEPVSEYEYLDLDDPEVLQAKMNEELFGTGSFRPR